MKKTLVSAMCLLFTNAMAHAADSPVDKTQTTTDHVQPDNTGINKRDRQESSLTPLDQSGSKADREITQAIRKSIMKQELSMNAKNIKVITRNGEVTLRGPVGSQSEIDKIVTLAKAIPGIKTLNNELEIK